MSQESEAALGGRENHQAVPGSQAGPGSENQAAPSSQNQAVRGSENQAAPGGQNQAPSDSRNQAAPGDQATAGPGPVLLPANPVFRFYKGGAGIDSFRGVSPGSGPGAPEDWVGSTTTSFGNDSEGLARLADGRVLRAAIAADALAFLGPEHVARLAANPGLLVKLLDAGERLAVHFHPGREFAHEYLHSNFGKTEAWLILEAAPGAHMHLGLRESIEPETLKRWVSEQNSEEMLRALNEVPVSAGDSLFVPAGTLHTIGEGITLIELQEPSDMSVVIEWRHAGVKNDEANLELGWETILPAADIDASPPIHFPAAPVEPGVSTQRRLLPAEADVYFRAQLLTVENSQPLELEPQFAIVIGTDGALTITSEAHEPLTLTRGQAALIPFAAGRTTVSGNGSAIRCLPPSTTEPGAGAW